MGMGRVGVGQRDNGKEGRLLRDNSEFLPPTGHHCHVLHQSLRRSKFGQRENLADEKCLLQREAGNVTNGMMHHPVSK